MQFRLLICRNSLASPGKDCESHFELLILFGIFQADAHTVAFKTLLTYVSVVKFPNWLNSFQSLFPIRRL